MNCPNCATEMDRLGLEGVHGPSVEIDLCFPCHVAWFDRRESIHLSPGGTLELFRALHRHGEDPRHALGARLRCPRCGKGLSLTNDIGKGGRFQYWACPARHGRLTPFSEFLKEKQFVRTLSPAEQHQVRARIEQLDCSGCGAPIDVVAGFACGHCGSPVTVLDPDAVERTLKQLDRADRRRPADPVEREARARALAAIETLRTDPVDTTTRRPGLGRGGIGTDLLTASFRVLFGPL